MGNGILSWEPGSGNSVLADKDGSWLQWTEGGGLGVNRWWALLRIDVLVRQLWVCRCKGLKGMWGKTSLMGGCGGKGGPCSSHVSHRGFPS